MSAEGQAYFINHNDKTTHWTRPEPPLAILAEDAAPGSIDSPRAAPTVVPAEEDYDTAVLTYKNITPFATTDGNGAIAASHAVAGGPAVVSRSMSTGDKVPVGTGARKAKVVADKGPPRPTVAELEEVADASGYFESESLAERAPSATVEAAAGVHASVPDVQREVVSVEPPANDYRSMDRSVPPTADPFVAASAPVLVAAEAEKVEPAAAVAAAVTGPAAAGPVSSIVKSGLFGATVTRSGSGSGGVSGGSTAVAPKGGGGPTSASSAGGGTSPAAGAAAGGSMKASSELPPLGEGEASSPRPIVFGYCSTTCR